jgi:hypothetical protein
LFYFSDPIKNIQTDAIVDSVDANPFANFSSIYIFQIKKALIKMLDALVLIVMIPIHSQKTHAGSSFFEIKNMGKTLMPKINQNYITLTASRFIGEAHESAIRHLAAGPTQKRRRPVVAAFSHCENNGL